MTATGPEIEVPSCRGEEDGAKANQQLEQAGQDGGVTSNDVAFPVTSEPDCGSAIGQYRVEPPKKEPVVVETVDSEDTSTPKLHQQYDNDTEVINSLADDVFPRSIESAIRFSMTLLAACLVLAVALTLFSAIRSHNTSGFLFLIVMWVVLFVLFAGLIRFLRSVVLEQQNVQIFHPYVHAMADMVAQEYRDFRDDWKNEYLLMLEDGPAAVEDEYVNMDQTQRTTSRRPKSFIFRTLVRPVMKPLFARRRKRKMQQQQQAVAAAENYVPPQV